MDNRQRLNDLYVAIKTVVDGELSSVWTAVPGILQSFDPVAMTCTVQPSIQGRVKDIRTGAVESVNLPVLVDVPVQLIGGGGFTLTFPMAGGDEGLVVFASRCIDAWWQNGGVQPQAELRLHDLSDGFFIPGFRSQARKLSGVSIVSTQLRSDDGTMSVDLNHATGTMTLKAPIQIVLDTPVTHMKGGLVIDGDVSHLIGGGGVVNFGNASIVTTGDITSNGKVLDSHTHGGVQSGGGTSGPPT